MKASNGLVACAIISIAGAQVVAAQAAQAPKPGPEHARLGYFVGKWKTEGEAKPGPMGPGGKRNLLRTLPFSLYAPPAARTACRS